MNDPIKLVTTKSDAELAEELKQEIVEALAPALAACTKATQMGFVVSCRMGPNGFKQMVLNQLTLSKVF
jgi:hypothetical protein